MGVSAGNIRLQAGFGRKPVFKIAPLEGAALHVEMAGIPADFVLGGNQGGGLFGTAYLFIGFRAVDNPIINHSVGAYAAGLFAPRTDPGKTPGYRLALRETFLGEGTTTTGQVARFNTPLVVLPASKS